MRTSDKLPKEALEFFRRKGRIGGRKRAENMTPEERSKQARDAVQARWAKSKGKRTQKGAR
jgi:hypothetical protein